MEDGAWIGAMGVLDDFEEEFWLQAPPVEDGVPSGVEISEEFLVGMPESGG